MNNADFWESINGIVADGFTPEGLQKLDHYAELLIFYHSDHLGSASWITEINGDAVQHLQYLPYGERYVDQRVSGYHERFTFTGKERDEETGYGYFGARYMDHELMTMWLSVDPLADKYPSISPYAYCAWNPVRLVDPDGRTIWIENGDGTKIKYEVNMKVQGDKFSQQTIETLNEMYTTSAGEKLLNSLSGSKDNFHISSESSGVPGTHSTKKEKDGVRSRMGGSSSMLDLSHELFHQYQYLCGQGGATYFNEVEAYLFSERLTNDYCMGQGKGFSMGSSLMSRHPDTKRGQAFDAVTSFLKYSSVFSSVFFEFAVMNFKDQAGANDSGDYNASYYKERTGKEKYLLRRFYEPSVSSK